MKLKTFAPSDVAGKKVLVRVDFNVPLTQEGAVADKTRLEAHIPLVRELVAAGARVALISHFGRPKGEVVAKYSLAPVAAALSDLMKKKITFVPACVGEEVAKAMEKASTGDVLLLENLRFHPGEEKNDRDFARKLALPFDVFVMDAFSASHRAHASTRGIVDFLPSFAGPLLLREIDRLSQARDNPRSPYVLILGGAKVSDKIAVIESMIERVDTIIIGGGMAFTFLKAQGKEIGRSLCEEERLDFAREMFKRAKEKGVSLLLPCDVVVAREISSSAATDIVPVDCIPADRIGLDIGPQTVELFKAALDEARTVVWNGPMGVFEMPPFADGTKAIAGKLAEITKKGAFTVIGGGDSAAAIVQFKHEKDVTHVSTGGGASLEFFEGRMLPGVEPYLVS